MSWDAEGRLCSHNRMRVLDERARVARAAHVLTSNASASQLRRAKDELKKAKSSLSGMQLVLTEHPRCLRCR